MTDVPQTDRLLGEVLDGRFRLDRLLGAGGMGKVYGGHQLSVEREVAVKVLREELSESESLAQRFFREAKVVASLRHPNIVGLVDFGRDRDRGLLYIAMEFVDGVSLAQLLRRGRLTPALTSSIARQVCSALAEAHAAGVVHRDLKPDNVMLVTTAEGALSVKVLDFGIALPTGEEARLTNTGSVVGTPHYMAPEQAQDQPVTGRADVYALGILMYEMLTGRLPFVADTPMAVLLKVITQTPPAISEILDPADRPPASLVSLLEQMIVKDPAARPSDMAEVGRRLDEIARTERLVAPAARNTAELESLVLPRASESFVYGATAASPVPTPRSTAPATRPPESTTQPPRPSAQVPEQRRFQWTWKKSLLACIVVLPCCIPCCLSSLNPDQGRVAPTPSAEEVEPEGRPDIGLELELQLESDPVEAEPLEPAEPAEPLEPLEPEPGPSPAPSSGTPPPRDMFKAQMAAGGHCNAAECNFEGTTPPGAAVCTDGSTCTARCPISGCPQICNAGAECDYACAGGGCQQVCQRGAKCKLGCVGGNCQQTCDADADCQFSCVGGNCKQNCIGERCRKTCTPGNCG